MKKRLPHDWLFKISYECTKIDSSVSKLRKFMEDNDSGLNVKFM